MNSDQFESLQRSREWFHGLRLLQGAWPVVRVDGRSFTRFTEERGRLAENHDLDAPDGCVAPVRIPTWRLTQPMGSAPCRRR
jgi:hypothetical protein